MSYLLAPAAIVGVVFNLADDLPGELRRTCRRGRDRPLPDRRSRAHADRLRPHRARSARRRRRLPACGLGLHGPRRRRAACGFPRSHSPAASSISTATAFGEPTFGTHRCGGRSAWPPSRRSPPDSAGAAAGRRWPRSCRSPTVAALLRAVDPPAPDPGAALAAHPPAARSRRLVRALPLPVSLRLSPRRFGVLWAVARSRRARDCGCPGRARPLPPARTRLRWPPSGPARRHAAAPLVGGRPGRRRLLRPPELAGAAPSRPRDTHGPPRPGRRLAPGARHRRGPGRRAPQPRTPAALRTSQPTLSKSVRVAFKASTRSSSRRRRTSRSSSASTSAAIGSKARGTAREEDQATRGRRSGPRAARRARHARAAARAPSSSACSGETVVPARPGEARPPRRAAAGWSRTTGGCPRSRLRRSARSGARSSAVSPWRAGSRGRHGQTARSLTKRSGGCFRTRGGATDTATRTPRRAGRAPGTS